MDFEDCVIKRNGEKEVFSFDKIYNRIVKLGKIKKGKMSLMLNIQHSLKKLLTDFMTVFQQKRLMN